MWAVFFYCSYTDPCQNQTRIDPAITGERFRKNSQGHIDAVGSVEPDVHRDTSILHHNEVGISPIREVPSGVVPRSLLRPRTMMCVEESWQTSKVSAACTPRSI